MVFRADDGNSAEFFDPVTSTWTDTTPRPSPTGNEVEVSASLVDGCGPNCGKILVGSRSGSQDYQARRWAVFNPGTGGWEATAQPNQPLSDPDLGPGIARLRGRTTECGAVCGGVLLTGGASDFVPDQTPEQSFRLSEMSRLYDPATATWSVSASMAHPRKLHTLTVLADGRVLAVGGSGIILPDSYSELTAELFDPVCGTWVTIAPPSQAHTSASATALADGSVLVHGGDFSDKVAEVYQPGDRGPCGQPSTPGIWTQTAPPPPVGACLSAPELGSATLLPNHQVLVVGGTGAALYDPVQGRWSSAGAPSGAFGCGASVTVLTGPRCAASCGKVLVAGGDNQPGTFTSSLLYTPAPVLDGIVSPPLATGPSDGGTQVVLSGFFTSDAQVSFGDGDAAPVPGQVSPDGAHLVVATPPHAAGTVNLSVTTAGGTTGSIPYTYVPSLVAAQPTNGPTTGGTSVTLSGRGLARTSVVSIGGTDVLCPGPACTSSGDTEITFTSPPHPAGSVDVAVSTDGRTSAPISFSYLPTVTALDPTGGPAVGGTSVAVSGSGFSGASAVSFGGAEVACPGACQVADDTRLSVTTPAHAAGPVDMVVTAGGEASPAVDAARFSFIGPTEVPPSGDTPGNPGGGSPTSGGSPAGQGASPLGGGTTGSPGGGLSTTANPSGQAVGLRVAPSASGLSVAPVPASSAGPAAAGGLVIAPPPGAPGVAAPTPTPTPLPGAAGLPPAPAVGHPGVALGAPGDQEPGPAAGYLMVRAERALPPVAWGGAAMAVAFACMVVAWPLGRRLAWDDKNRVRAQVAR